MAKFSDIKNFLGKLTLYKVLNALKIIASYQLARTMNKPLHWGMPITLSVEPTTECNLGCPECPSGVKFFTRPTGYMDEKLFDKTLDETARHLLYLYFYFQGEPYLHPQFLSFVKKAADKKIYTVTSTNGHFLTERKAEDTVTSGLDRIIISLDGTNQESYSKYRIGGNYEKVISGVKNLVAARKKLRSSTPHIVLQFIVMKHNEHEIGAVKTLAKELGVDELKMKTVQVYNQENSELIPANSHFSRYENENGKLKIKNNFPNHCWKLWHSGVITQDGKVAPCCFDKDASHRLGDLSSQSFAEIWRNDKYDDFRAKITQSRKAIDICTNCSEGTKVWIED